MDRLGPVSNSLVSFPPLIRALDTSTHGLIGSYQQLSCLLPPPPLHLFGPWIPQPIRINVEKEIRAYVSFLGKTSGFFSGIVQSTAPKICETLCGGGGQEGKESSRLVFWALDTPIQQEFAGP